jgi:poly-gamma-glutamate capsule biosynthesis protein CapA/YwtB (metallophosphatase superfamily)
LKPERANSIKEAGINVVTLANNHLLDCGRAAVLDTLESLTQAGLSPLGAGSDETTAQIPVIQLAQGKRIGLLNYYWNPRTAARENRPGSCRDTPERLEAGIRSLREKADRVVVIFHWGIPYKLTPLPEDLAKARFAIDCGADVVVGHHPHVIQPFEVYRGHPIFYSVGNFTFGSGNSKAEGMIVSFHFEDGKTGVLVHPLYVKNRDPRVAYQPKVLGGEAALHKLGQLVSRSGASGELLQIENGVGRLSLLGNGSLQA